MLIVNDGMKANEDCIDKYYDVKYTLMQTEVENRTDNLNFKYISLRKI